MKVDGGWTLWLLHMWKVELYASTKQPGNLSLCVAIEHMGSVSSFDALVLDLWTVTDQLGIAWVGLRRIVLQTNLSIRTKKQWSASAEMMEGRSIVKDMAADGLDWACDWLHCELPLQECPCPCSQGEFL